MSDTTDPAAVYTTNDVAAILGRSPEWVTERANTGAIPSQKVGRSRRFTAADVAAYLQGRKEGRS